MTRLNSIEIGIVGRVAMLENALSDQKIFCLDCSKALQIVRSMAKTVSVKYLLENTKAGVSKEKKRIRTAYTKNVFEDQIEGQSPGKNNSYGWSRHNDKNYYAV